MDFFYSFEVLRTEMTSDPQAVKTKAFTEEAEVMQFQVNSSHSGTAQANERFR